MNWINLKIKDDEYLNGPEYNESVLVQLEHWKTKNIKYAVLQRVEEDDVSWRTDDDYSELSYGWNVIKWCKIK